MQFEFRRIDVINHFHSFIFPIAVNVVGLFGLKIGCNAISQVKKSQLVKSV